MILVLVLILILVLILVLVVLTASASTVLLVLQHQFGIDVILLGVKVVRTTEERLLEGLHRGSIVLLLESRIAGIVEYIRRGVDGLPLRLRGRVRKGRNLSRGLRCRSHRPCSLLIGLLPVQGIGEIICPGHGGRVLQHRLAVVDFGRLEVTFTELAVAGAHLPAVRLAGGGDGQQQQGGSEYQ